MDTDTGKQIVCEPCSTEDTQVPATHFCKTCDDPEPLCETCAKHHTKQKQSRNHEICRDMREYRINEQNEICPTLEVSGNNENPKNTNSRTPGKPRALKIYSDSVDLVWPKTEEGVKYYQIYYKIRDGQENIVKTDTDHNQFTITGLAANTKYIFKVRGVFHDQEGQYGPMNDNIQTKIPFASHLLESAKLVADGNPAKYQLSVQELKESRNSNAKTKTLVLGEPKEELEEKTIMLVGATGSGKSTLVDGIVNYVTGVSFDDPFRFTIVQLEEEEQNTDNQAISQTEWVNVYKIVPQEGHRLDYTLNIIDTPGFGDTRGLDRDEKTIDQIRHLFSEAGSKGLVHLDAVCFIVKAPDARLTASQLYIFGSIMSLFGKDIESNICTLITFADGAEPPVIASLKAANIPYGKTFHFNNSALFAENKNLAPTSFSPICWAMGCNGFKQFFDEIYHFETRSLTQTKNVLKDREQLKTTIAGILPQVQAGLSKIGMLRDELEIFEKHKRDINENKDFEYEVEKPKPIKVDLKPGYHVTNCLKCNLTCHKNCIYADDNDKINCCAMKDGNCTVCKLKCKWEDHKNMRYIIEYTVEKVKTTFYEKKRRYENAKGLKMKNQSFLEKLTEDVENLFEEVGLKMIKMKECKSRLKKIALRPDPLSTTEHIDLMIEAEKRETKPGYEKRINMLYNFKEKALIDENFKKFNEDMESAKTAMETHGIPTNSLSKKEENLLQRGGRLVKNIFSPSQNESEQK